MTIGGGITLIVIGLILALRVVEVDIPYLNEYALGVILILAGIVAVVLTLTVWRNAGTRHTVVERRRGNRRVVERVVERDVIDPPL